MFLFLLIINLSISVNGDGVLDIVSANVQGNSISLLAGVGDGTFRVAVEFATASVPTIPAIGDLNSLGLQDIVVASLGTSTVQVFLGDGGVVQSVPLNKSVYMELSIENASPEDLTNVSFLDTMPSILSINSSLAPVGEGCVDLVTTSSEISLSGGLIKGQSSCVYRVLLLGVQEGLTSGFVNVSSDAGDTSSNAVSLEVVDAPKVLVSFEDEGGSSVNEIVVHHLVILKIEIQNVASTVSLVGVEFDYALPVEFVVTSVASSGTGCIDAEFTSTSVSLKDGIVNASSSCVYRAHVTITTTGISTAQLSVGALNANGALSNEVSVLVIPPPIVRKTLRRTGAHLFSNFTFLSIGSQPVDIVARDLNGDGVDDLAVANQGFFVGVMIGNGDMTFKTQVPYLSAESPSFIMLEDVSGDGMVDLIASNKGSNSISVRVNAGNGNFLSLALYETQESPFGVAVDDFDEAVPVKDIAVANTGSNSISVFTNTGTGSFGNTAAHFPACAGPMGMASSDFNLDGKKDLVVACNSSNSIAVAFGDGNGNFGSFTEYAAQVAPQRVQVADVDGDGLEDVVCSNLGSNSVSVFIGTGAAFYDAVHYAVGVSPKSVRLVDLDKSGTIDIVSSNSGSNDISVLRGNGDGTFESEIRVAVAASPESVALADTNNSGLFDIVTANKNVAGVSFVHGSFPLNAFSTLPPEIEVSEKFYSEILIQNNNDFVLTDVSFTDTYPSALKVLSNPIVNALGHGCTAASSTTSSVSLSSGSIPPFSSCLYTVLVDAHVPSTSSNSVTVSSANGTVTSNVVALVVNDVLKAPIVQISYRDAPDEEKFISVAQLDQEIRFRVSIANNNAVVMSSASFAHDIPVELTLSSVSSPNGCPAVVSTVSSLSVSGDIPASTVCVYVASLNAVSLGSIVIVENVTSANLPIATSNIVVLDVFAVLPPSATVSFTSQDGAVVGKVTVGDLVFYKLEISNSNFVPLNNATIDTAIPAELVVNSLSSSGGSCPDGSFTDSQISMNGAIARGSVCVYTANLTTVTPGLSLSLSTTVTSSNAPSATSNVATLEIESIVLAPVVVLVYRDWVSSNETSHVELGLPLVLEMRAENVNAVDLINATFSLTVPAQVQVHNVTVSAGCPTASFSTSTVTMDSQTFPASSTCIFRVDLVTVDQGNSVTFCTLSSANAPAGTSNSVSLNVTTVVLAPTLSLLFTDEVETPIVAVAEGGSAVLHVSVNNANLVPVTGVNISLPFQTELSVIGVGGSSSDNCSNALSFDSSSVTIRDGVLPKEDICVFTVNVTSSTAASTSTSATLDSSNAPSVTSDPALLDVLASPSVSAVFKDDSNNQVTFVSNGNTIFLDVTIENPNLLDLSGAAFSLAVPVEFSAFNVSMSGAGCVEANFSSSSVDLSSGAIAAQSSCVYRVHLTAVASGSSSVQLTVLCDIALSAMSNVASIDVTSVPFVEVKYRNSQGVSTPGGVVGDEIQFELVIANSNPVAFVDVSFTHNVISQLTVTELQNNGAAGCTAAIYNSTTLTMSLENGTVPASGQCLYKLITTANAPVSTITVVAVAFGNAVNRNSNEAPFHIFME